MNLCTNRNRMRLAPVPPNFVKLALDFSFIALARSVFIFLEVELPSITLLNTHFSLTGPLEYNTWMLGKVSILNIRVVIFRGPTE